MSIPDSAWTFAGLPVRDFHPDGLVDDPSATAYALRGGDGPDAVKQLRKLVRDRRAAGVTALVLGSWGEDDGPGRLLEALAGARDSLPALRALFLGDIVETEHDLSAIRQADLSGLLEAFPALGELRVRGGAGLRFSRPRHAQLR